MIKKLTNFKSSNVAAAEYNPANRELDITFRDGTTYQYDGVSSRRFNQFQAADSKGHFVHEKIVPNYKATKE